jgi:nucleotide sugar dehydrogenase
MDTIGIIGNGFVGGAIAEGFKQYTDVKVYDKKPEKSCHTLTDTISQDIVFVCLPTPMSLNENGSCDLSYIEDFFDECLPLSPKCIFVIKSTVSIGATSSFKNKYKHFNIVHSPEFLTARTAALDFITPSRIIIGYPKDFYSNTHHIPNSILDLFKQRFPGANILMMNSEESELVKYTANCFFATKISYFNEIKILCDKLNLNYENIMGGVLSDGRIGVSHYQVPGHDGKPGFGGACFPKDINSLINVMKDNKIKPNVLEGAWQTNLEVRPEKDCGDFSSAVSKDKEFFSKENGMDQSGCGHDHI